MAIEKKEAHMGSVPADVYLIKSGGKYKADPPRPKVHPLTRNQLCIRNFTGSDVYLWFPGRFMVGAAPADVYVLRDGETPCFTVPDTTVAGVYSYAAYVVAAKEFVEGNTPPDIIIDK